MYLNLISWPPIDFLEPHRPQLFGLYSPISPETSSARPLYISTADGAKLGVWHLSRTAASDDSGPASVLIYCHGNAESRAYGPSHRRYESALAEGYDVVTFDYRGFADSEGPAWGPTEEGVVTDATAVWQWVTGTGSITASRQSLGVDPSRVVVWGHSLGTGVAVQLLRVLEEDHGTGPRLVVGEYTATTFYCFLLLPITPSVSCSCSDPLNTPSSELPPSPTVSRFLQPV